MSSKQISYHSPSTTTTSSDEHDLVTLFDRYHQEVYRLCLGILDNQEDAEDATQEVFLRAYRAWDSYDPTRAAPRTWLGAITVNYCRSLRRRYQTRRFIQRLWHNDVGFDDGHLGHRDLSTDISNALQGLTLQERSIILLRFYMGLQCTEIAHALQISERTVYSRLSKAYAQLQLVLDDEGHADG
ncbi:MAG: sigma-70 family RNA polymerase sigma factor [Chloroflexota bacterium]